MQQNRRFLSGLFALKEQIKEKVAIYYEHSTTYELDGQQFNSAQLYIIYTVQYKVIVYQEKYCIRFQLKCLAVCIVII